MKFSHAGTVLARNGFRFFGSTSSTNKYAANADIYFLIYYKKNKSDKVIASALVSMLNNTEHMIEIFNSKISFDSHDDLSSCAIVAVPVTDGAWTEKTDQLEILEIYLKSMDK